MANTLLHDAARWLARRAGLDDGRTPPSDDSDLITPIVYIPPAAHCPPDIVHDADTQAILEEMRRARVNAVNYRPAKRLGIDYDRQ